MNIIPDARMERVYALPTPRRSLSTIFFAFAPDISPGALVPYSVIR